jgi:hypothetical protein
MKDVPETESNHGVNDMALHKAVWVAVALAASINAHAQVAGTQPLSVTVEQSQALLQGWSVKKSVLGKAVYNDQNEASFKVRVGALPGQVRAQARRSEHLTRVGQIGWCRAGCGRMRQSALQDNANNDESNPTL